ncbi:MAG: single-stranded DNA-binding protein [Dehalococcoidia bacterium]|jgi:single-strand DNA-binding protein|nr:single-stranded DNA-binding protein [Dehalococcoidia bacterium]HJN58594.1 single-stranded DNA-binding protein [Dehalococcoidia bacterium]
MLNKIMLIGNLGADPELRYTPSGDPVTNFNMAVTNYFTDNSGEQRNHTEWFEISVWGRQAESVNQYLAKGSKVYVEGRFQSREYVGADGQTRKAYGVRANTVQFLDRRQDNNQNQETESKGNIENSEEEPQNKNNEEQIEDLPW